MKIAVASGKGGTGKTTIATNLAFSISQKLKTLYLDCDVEEPNGHIFLKPEIETVQDVTVGVPEVNEEKCNGCGECAKLCQYSAIVCLQEKPLLFEKLCHSCGGCMEVCPENAITEKQRKIGISEFGKSSDLVFGHGILDITNIQSVSLINSIKKIAPKCEAMIIDSPPGTSCPVIETVNDVDFILLVTEPTPFGLNDLKLAVDMARELNIKFAVVINRADVGDDGVKKYCEEENIDILLEIPNDRKIAEAYSNGTMIVDVLAEYKETFQKLYQSITDLVSL